MEKAPVLPMAAGRPKNTSRLLSMRQLSTVLGLLGVLCLVAMRQPAGPLIGSLTTTTTTITTDGSEGWCPLPPVVSVSADVDGLLPSEHLMSAEQRALQVRRLAAAVQVPTQSYDDSGDVDTDPRWAPFPVFHQLLEDLFPRVHERLQLRKVHRYGLLYTLYGSEASLKPIVFMAHQDVVPADTSAPWTHPPFEGYFDGEFLWGRGSADCKNVLIGLLSVLEDLLGQEGFAPRRTIVLSFGFDEEVGGPQGAAWLSRALEEEWGRDGVLLLLDEGGMGVSAADKSGEQSERSEDSNEDSNEASKILFAYPGVGEKGAVDLQLTLAVDGGHSSRPPPHTGIGIMADVIHALETPLAGYDHPFAPRLPSWSPFRRVLECRAQYGPAGTVPAWLRSGLLRDSEEGVARRLVEAARGVGGETEDERWLMQTSQAVDVITGGYKVNALPELVTVTVNYRVALHETAEMLLARAAEVLRPVIERYELELVSETKTSETSETSEASRSMETTSEETREERTLTNEARKTKGFLTITPQDGLKVAPLSPTGPSDGVWMRFSGILRSVFESTESGQNGTVVPVGSIMTGNTDTAHYWALSRNIYRFTPSREGTRVAAHAIDERMEMTAHLEGMRVYYDLIRSFDGWAEGPEE